MMVLKRIPCNTFVRESGEYIYTYYAFKENAFILHHKIVIFHGFLLLFCLFVLVFLGFFCNIQPMLFILTDWK